jgi:hypothetical protein
MNEEVSYKKILNCINTAFIVDLKVLLDEVKYGWFNKIKICK